jgi:hypothetical protein
MESFENVVDHAFMQAGVHALDECKKSDTWTKTPGTAVAKNLGSGLAVHWYYVNSHGTVQDSWDMKFQRTQHGLCQWFTYVHYMADHNDKRAKDTAASFIKDDEVGNDMKIFDYVFGSARQNLKSLANDLLYRDNILEWFNHGKQKKYRLTLEQLDSLYGDYTAKTGKREHMPLNVPKRVFRNAIHDAFKAHLGE